MMESVNPRLSLQTLDAEQGRLCERLAALTTAERETSSNLTGWQVNDLAVHITRVCDSILRAVQRAQQGDRTSAFGPAAKPREDEIRAMTPADWAALQRSEYGQLSRIIGGLSDADLEEMSFPHPQGERPVSWYCTQLLAETTFHRWDLEHSLGADGPLDDALAAYLLPFLLEPSRLLFGAKRSDGPSQSFTVSDGEHQWTLNVTSEGCAVAATSERAEATITASPGWLALAVYGRVRIDRAEFRLTGGTDVADRFAVIFGPNQ
ncbi:MAG: maleylpyruvate isomerase family mycothiol-dependent enzyme [Chloroflexota bacterium]